MCLSSLLPSLQPSRPPSPGSATFLFFFLPPQGLPFLIPSPGYISFEKSLDGLKALPRKGRRCVPALSSLRLLLRWLSIVLSFDAGLCFSFLQAISIFPLYHLRSSTRPSSSRRTRLARSPDSLLQLPLFLLPSIAFLRPPKQPVGALRTEASFSPLSNHVTSSIPPSQLVLVHHPHLAPSSSPSPSATSSNPPSR